MVEVKKFIHRRNSEQILVGNRHKKILLFPYFLATQDNFCGTETLCKKDTFKDGKCDPQNNNRVCGYDGGDCCSTNPGWDSRCKELEPLVSTIQFLLFVFSRK